jgi:fatty acid desaturase
MSAIPQCFKLDRAEFERLRHRPWWALPCQLFVIVGSYVGLSMVAVRLSMWPVWLMVWWVQGFILSGFLGAAHDCAHGKFVSAEVGGSAASKTLQIWKAGK